MSFFIALSTPDNHRVVGLNVIQKATSVQKCVAAAQMYKILKHYNSYIYDNFTAGKYLKQINFTPNVM